MSDDLTFDYDLVVIGSGPGGHRAAIQAAKLGRRVAVIEKRASIGGVCLHTGTIPSKTLRQAALRLSGYHDQDFYGASHAYRQKITMKDLLFRVDQVIANEIDVAMHQLRRNDVAVFAATASFVDAHTLELAFADGGGTKRITAHFVVIAVGTVTTKDASVPFDGKTVFTSDDILTMDRLPASIAVIGAGVIGLEYACIFAALGVRVTLIDRHPQILPFVDREIMDLLVHHLRERRATIRLGESVAGIDRRTDAHGASSVHVRLASGKELSATCVLHSIGRTGATDGLHLERAGLAADDRGRLVVDPEFRTRVPHVFAVGDVVGFPALASTSMEQGRMAACHAFGHPHEVIPSLFPYGIYSVPGISMVGKTEEELTKANVPYESGRASYREIARGHILGDRTGLLKLLFHRESRKILGVHIVGAESYELIHIGQAVMAFGGTIDYFVNTVFNYPTFAEAYKTAAFDGVNRVGTEASPSMS